MTMRLAPSVDAHLQRTSLQQNHVYQSWLPERSAFGGVAQPKGAATLSPDTQKF
jgi:hypothetical protein